jgi:hypothetical protein
MLDTYANLPAVHSCRLSIAGRNAPSFSEGIRHGPTLVEVGAKDLAEYSRWARSIGEKRINHIVSNKFRSAYDRAAGALAALAETLAASGQPDKAGELLREYYQRRFIRFTAFRREVTEAVSGSTILKKLGLIW